MISKFADQHPKPWSRHFFAVTGRGRVSDGAAAWSSNVTAGTGSTVAQPVLLPSPPRTRLKLLNKALSPKPSFFLDPRPSRHTRKQGTGSRLPQSYWRRQRTYGQAHGSRAFPRKWPNHNSASVGGAAPVSGAVPSRWLKQARWRPQAQPRALQLAGKQVAWAPMNVEPARKFRF